MCYKKVKKQVEGKLGILSSIRDPKTKKQGNKETAKKVVKQGIAADILEDIYSESGIKCPLVYPQV